MYIRNLKVTLHKDSGRLHLGLTYYRRARLLELKFGPYIFVLWLRGSRA